MTDPQAQRQDAPQPEAPEDEVTLDCSFLYLTRTDNGSYLHFSDATGTTVKVRIPDYDLDGLRDAATAAADNAPDGGFGSNYLDLRMI